MFGVQVKIVTHNFLLHSVARSILNSGRLTKPSAFSSCHRTWQSELKVTTSIQIKSKKMIELTSSFMYQYRHVSFRMNQYFFHFCEKYVLASFFFHSQPSQSPWPRSLQEIRRLLIEDMGLSAAGASRADEGVRKHSHSCLNLSQTP